MYSAPAMALRGPLPEFLLEIVPRRNPETGRQMGLPSTHTSTPVRTAERRRASSGSCWQTSTRGVSPTLTANSAGNCCPVSTLNDFRRRRCGTTCGRCPRQNSSAPTAGFWNRDLLDNSSDEQVAELLDSLTGRLPGLRPALGPPPGRPPGQAAGPRPQGPRGQDWGRAVCTTGPASFSQGMNTAGTDTRSVAKKPCVRCVPGWSSGPASLKASRLRLDRVCALFGPAPGRGGLIRPSEGGRDVDRFRGAR